MAILRLGVDKAMLWHFFDENVASDLVAKYISACYGIIFLLGLPIGYSAYLLESAIQYRTENGKLRLKPIDGPFITPIYTSYYQAKMMKQEYGRRDWWRYSLHSPKKNPLLDEPLICDIVRRAREFLRLTLRIPSR